MSERICVVHVGTHKTGTTSQQNFLLTNWEELLRKGILYVTAGWFEGLAGNHRVAWDLLTQDTSGHLDDAVAELRETNVPTAIMSSEDFLLLSARPRALELLRDAIVSAGYRPKILLYLRAQPTYAESHYVERVKQGHIVGLDSFVREVLETGAYAQPNSDVRLEFLYSRLVAPFVDVFSRENVMVRVFGKSKEVGFVFQDFVAALAELSPTLAGTPFQLRVTRPRENDSLSFLELLGKAASTLAPQESAKYDRDSFVARYAPDVPPALLDARYSLLTRPDWLSLLERFGPDNRTISKEFGIDLPFCTPDDVPGGGDERWKIAELERAVYDRTIETFLNNA